MSDDDEKQTREEARAEKEEAERAEERDEAARKIGAPTTDPVILEQNEQK